MSISVIDIIRVLIVVPTLLYASYTDLRERRVADVVWLPAILVGTLLALYELSAADAQQLAPKFLANLLFLGLFGLLLYKGKVFYRADFKAFVVLAIILPTYPTIGQYPLIVPPDFTYRGVPTTIIGLTILVNTALAGLFYPLVTAAKNIQNRAFSIRHPLRSFTARKVTLTELHTIHGHILPPTEGPRNPLHFFSDSIGGLNAEFISDYTEWTGAETFGDVEKINLEAFLRHNDEWDCTNIEEDKETLTNIKNSTEVWVTPGAPFMVPLTVGVLLSLIVGDLVYALVLAI